MLNAFGWVLFGFAVWGLCIVMHAVQKRFAPEWNSGEPGQNWWDFLWGDDGSSSDGAAKKRTEFSKDREISDLKKRIETLETIVTDRHYQFDDELRNPRS